MGLLVVVHIEGEGDGLVEVDFASDQMHGFCGNTFTAWVKLQLLLFQVATRGLDMLGALSRKSPMVAWKLNLYVLISSFILFRI
jgi:hypothetical protein